ncbi:sulfotransferase [Luteimonas granuli]|uniref:sulfotransferase n=1 Tax=Luteimonas granuli TaxID=1176533 RepID=UPI00143CEA5A|nr:sulfotransferase [Luteimonas granuli]
MAEPVSGVPAEGPRIRFLLGGVQKGGTSALARFLAEHPQLALPARKEAHVFDATDFDEAWSVDQVDARFAPHFDAADEVGADRLHGDATPITLFHPALVARVARYNPAMRWVLLLRDPVERAVSHYFMERGRGLESRSLLAAVLLEPWRLRKHSDDWSPDSPLRVCSYVARGRYAGQLDVLLRHFPRGQVLLLRSRDLAARPTQVLAQVTDFLGVSRLPDRAGGTERVFVGDYRPPAAWSPGRLALRWRLRGEVAALARRHGVLLDP